MDTFLRFLYEFLSQIFNGFKFMALGIYRGVISIFNIPEYVRVVAEYKKDFSIPEWLLVAVTILITLALLALIVFAVYFVIKNGY